MMREQNLVSRNFTFSCKLGSFLGLVVCSNAFHAAECSGEPQPLNNEWKQLMGTV